MLRPDNYIIFSQKSLDEQTTDYWTAISMNKSSHIKQFQRFDKYIVIFEK